MSADTIRAIRALGFTCAPTDASSPLRVELSSVVPNKKVRALLSSWAVFPDGDAGRARLVPSADDARAAAGNDRGLVRVPFTGYFVRV